MKVTILLLSCLVLATEARSYALLSDLFQAASIARSDSQVEEPVNSIQQLQAQQQQQPVAEASNYDLQMPQYVQTRPSYQTSGGAQVSAAIQSKRTVEVKPVSIQQDPVEPHVVDVEASYQPVQVVFRSSSSPVMVQQIHTPSAPMQLEATQSEDEPHRVQHQVMRPVIQEIREIIQPYRRVLQEIRPVLEEVRTVVAKASDGNSAQVAPGSAIGVGSGLGGLGGGIGNAGGNGAGAGGLAGGLGAGQGYGGSQGAGQGYGGSQGAGQGYGGGQGGQSGGRYAGSGYDGQQNSRSSRGGNLRKSYSRRSGSLSKSRYQSNIQQYAARS